MGFPPACPLARTRTVSLVLISPSIQIRLKEPSTASRSDFCRQAVLIEASVVTKHSIVAMLGQIMPAPLAQAPIRIFFPPTVAVMAISLTAVSLVMMASAT